MTQTGVGVQVPESLRQFGGSAPLKTPEGVNHIERVRYTHDGMLDLIIANPAMSQNDIAKHFGYTQQWVSRIFCSDVFQARMAERKEELIDPLIRETVEERFKALIHQSQEILFKRLEGNPSDKLLLGTLNVAAKALGYGAKDATQINNNFVVQVPGKVSTSAEWAEIHRSAGSPAVGPGPGGILGRALPSSLSPEIVSPELPRTPAPPLPDTSQLLHTEVISK